MRVSWLSWVFVCATAGLGGCLVAETGATASPCADDIDCPSTHRCIALSEGQGVCEVRYPPIGDTSAVDTDAGTPDGGPVQSGDAGTPDAGVQAATTWCKDIQPVLNASCIASCHGTVNTGSNRKDFRLDVYATAGSVKGAKDMSARIKVRGVDQRNMPPSTSSSPQLTQAQRDLITRWVNAGAPECSDGGTP